MLEMSSCDGFRLRGSPSESSMRSKARIDALFEDSKSLCSSNFERCHSKSVVMPIISTDDSATDEQQLKINSAIQARIEAMFASVEADNGIPGECTAAVLPVKYLGAAPVGGRIASVQGLQEPLRQLMEKIDSSIPAELEVSQRGLTVRTSNVIETINPFRRIAVWSALKLHRKNLEPGTSHYAFIPLVGDELDNEGQEKHADLYRSMKDLTRKIDSYPAIFAVVMRRPGATKLLECHAFACHTEEDAVAAAATLYKALLADMDANNVNVKRRPRQTNGVGCVSLASVVSSDKEGWCRSSLPSQFDVEHPVRPPRAKKNVTCKVEEEDNAIRSGKKPRRKKPVLPAVGRNFGDSNHLEFASNIRVENVEKQVTPSFSDSVCEYVLENSLYGKSDEKERDDLPHGNYEYLKEQKPRRRKSRAGSEPLGGSTDKMADLILESKLKRSQSDVDIEKGDPMTRVELPRRSSFLNSGNKRRTTNTKEGTPLGFTELFDEFRNQEGLTSVDDILAAIIDPEGMSFNDLKPLYKEFLLKLASTLTQDELYQRSASIMRRHRRPQRRHSSRRPCVLSRAIKRSVSRLKSGPMEFTSVIFSKPNDSLESSSSFDVRNNQRNRLLSNRLNVRRPLHRRNRVTSEDSDTCRRLARSAGANRSSSGYVSCSECSYDSESCTCVSADKCYCSLSRRIATVPELAVICACDTDSCSESNKCYCQQTSDTRTAILNQLKQPSAAQRSQSLSRRCGKRRIETTRRFLPVSRSLEYLKDKNGPENLALDYDLFKSEGKSQALTAEEKILMVSARDPQGRLVYLGGSERNKKPVKNMRKQSSGHHEVLSFKKSAEIAAVFGSRYDNQCRRVNSTSSLTSSVSLEAGLGYLP